MKLTKILRKHSGRDNTGQVSVRHQGGRHKRRYRVIDFKRDKRNIAGTIEAIEYDPNRSVDIAKVLYADGERRYIIKPKGINVGDKIEAGENVDIKKGNALPLMKIPVGTVVHNIELHPGRGGVLVRSAGNQAFVASREEKYVQVKMPSGEVRRILGKNYATIGQLGNVDVKDRKLGKAGNSRRRGVRPTVRGVAMNPSSHPHGGGEGRSSVGMKHPKTYTGRKAVGITRKTKKYSDKFIVKKRGK